ncbi:MAG: sugar ABC transporter permease [bacterium]|nr:sugar ABC transporter permease [bacterium]
MFRPITGLGSGLFNAVLSLFDMVMLPLQRLVGVRGMAYVFVLPNLLIFGIFILLPMLLNFYYAFTGGTNIFPQDRTFVGAQNFETLLDCGNILNPNSCRQDYFWIALYNTALFVATQVGFMVLFSLLTALALNRKIAGRGFFRSVFFYPVLLSPVVVALIWKWILQENGVLNAVLVAFGAEPQEFLGSTGWARTWMVVISVWAQMGFYTLILLAGLQAIPAELYEASAIDGANAWKDFRFVTLPLLMPTLLVVLVLALIRAVQVFDQVYAFTGGGPGTATLYMVQYIYDTGFSNQIRNFGLASAASVVLAGALMLFTFLQLRLGRTSNLS